MRKRQISTTPPSAPPSSQAWLDVEHIALVEVTSEETGYPIEFALLGGENRRWRVAKPGAQTIRLIFDEPQRLRVSGWFLRIKRIRAPKSSSFDGLLTPENLSEKSYANSGISAHPAP